MGFIVRRGNAEAKLDVRHHHPSLRLQLNALTKSPFRLVALETLLSSRGIRYGTGTPPPIVERSASSVPFIRATDIKNGEIVTANLLHIDSVQNKNMDKCRVASDEIILVRSGVNTGDCAVVPNSLAGTFAAYDLIISLNNNEADPSFVASFLNTISGRSQLNTMKGRAAQPHLNAAEVASVRILLPELSVQHQMVADLNAARETRRAKLAQADALLAGLDGFVLDRLGIHVPAGNTKDAFAVKFCQVCSGRLDSFYHAPQFVHFVKALESCAYPKMTLGDISPKIAGGATPTKNNVDLYAENGIKFLRILNVTSHGIDLTDVKYITKAVHTGELGRSQLLADDVLMTITGRVGTASVVTEDVLPANINQHIVRIRIQRDDCLSGYLEAYLNTSIGLALSNRLVTGGTRIALDYEAVRGLLIPMPPLDIQRAIIAEVTHRREEARRLRAEAETVWQEAQARFEAQLLGGAV